MILFYQIFCRGHGFFKINSKKNLLKFMWQGLLEESFSLLHGRMVILEAEANGLMDSEFSCRNFIECKRV